MPVLILALFTLTEKAMSYQQIAVRFRVSIRQAMRIVVRLEELGFVITREGNYFQITAWPEEIQKFKK
jgi:DNA-binding IclR family transcriptional regulator